MLDHEMGRLGRPWRRPEAGSPPLRTSPARHRHIAACARHHVQDPTSAARRSCPTCRSPCRSRLAARCAARRGHRIRPQKQGLKRPSPHDPADEIRRSFAQSIIRPGFEASRRSAASRGPDSPGQNALQIRERPPHSRTAGPAPPTQEKRQDAYIGVLVPIRQKNPRGLPKSSRAARPGEPATRLIAQVA